MTNVTLTQLRKERAKLLKLKNKQLQERKRIMQLKKLQLEAKREEEKLKKEIRDLKDETSNKLKSKVKRFVKSENTKSAVKKGKKILKGIDKFIRSIPT